MIITIQHKYKLTHISFNIGFEGTLGSGTFTKYPIYYQMESFKEFSDFIRNQPFDWLLWAHENHVSKSHMCFHLTIWEQDKNNTDEYWSWNFKIRVKNIREYQPFLKLSREEVDEMKIQKERENKLNELLNSEEEIL